MVQTYTVNLNCLKHGPHIMQTTTMFINTHLKPLNMTTTPAAHTVHPQPAHALLFLAMLQTAAANLLRCYHKYFTSCPTNITASYVQYPHPAPCLNPHTSAVHSHDLVRLFYYCFMLPYPTSIRLCKSSSWAGSMAGGGGTWDEAKRGRISGNTADT